MNNFNMKVARFKLRQREFLVKKIQDTEIQYLSFIGKLCLQNCAQILEKIIIGTP